MRNKKIKPVYKFSNYPFSILSTKRKPTNKGVQKN